MTDARRHTDKCSDGVSTHLDALSTTHQAKRDALYILFRESMSIETQVRIIFLGVLRCALRSPRVSFLRTQEGCFREFVP